MSSLIFRRMATASASAARSFSTTSPRSFAKISILGNLVDAPELHETRNGRSVVRYSVASNSGPRDNRQTSFFRVSTFADGPPRDFLLSLNKGSLVFVEGDASMYSYADSKEVTRTTLNVVQRGFELIKRGREQDESEEHTEEQHTEQSQ